MRKFVQSRGSVSVIIPKNFMKGNEKKKKVFAAILSALMAVSLAACGGGSAGSSAAAPAESTKPAESTAPAAEGAKKIGISMPTQSLERWNRDGQYLDEQFKATGYETILTFSDNKSDRQVNDIQNIRSSPMTA